MLEILRAAKVEDNPFTPTPELNEELGAKFVALAHAVADFVEAGKDTIGYEDTRGMLEDMVHTFPVDEHQKDPFAELSALLTNGIPDDAPLITDGDNH